MKDLKRKWIKENTESDDIDIENMNMDLFMQKAEEQMEICEFMINELEKGNVKIPDQKDFEFSILSHATLISIIKDLQTIGIEGKNPKKVLKELKKLRASKYK